MSKGMFITVFFLQLVFYSSAQQLNYTEVDLDGNKNFLSSIEIAPDGKTLAIAVADGHIFLWDIASQKIIRKIEINGYSWGAYMNYSTDGKYLLLLQQFFTDFRINNDHPSRAEVLDVASEKILVSAANAHSAMLTPDSKSLITLEGDEIIFRDILSGEVTKKFKPQNVTNAFAISTDGNILAVSQQATEDELKNISTVRNDKKAMKEAMKFREVVVFYDAKTFAKKFVADDIFDIVFSMHYSADGNSLYLFNAPNRKLRTSASGAGASRNGYIQVINSSDGSASRVIYSTNATEPIYKESSDGKYFAATSIEQKFRVLNSVIVYNRESGSTFKNFVNDFRISENTHIGRASFEFLPDHKTIALGYGYKMALWNFEE